MYEILHLITFVHRESIFLLSSFSKAKFGTLEEMVALSKIPHNYVIVGIFVVLFITIAILFTLLEFLHNIFIHSLFYKNPVGFRKRLRNAFVYLFFLLFFPLFLTILIFKRNEPSGKS